MKNNKVNFESYTDCFSKTENIKTELLYGDIDAIPNPFITVLVPTYKRTKFLKEALDTILKQWHTHFFWDVIVLDNEEYNGKPNSNEKLIRKINNDRILYYRNREHMKPGDNFNRGIMLSRGDWVMMLHDDDLLVHNTVQYVEKLIKYCDIKCKQKPLGVISATYVQFMYDEKTGYPDIDIEGTNNYLSFLPPDFNLYRLNHFFSMMTGNVGCDIPSNGTTFRKKAVMECGGFNEDLGICADQFLVYAIEKNYSVFNTPRPLGFWRWSSNQSSKIENQKSVAKNQYDFRKYVYSKNIFSRLCGMMFRNSHNKIFLRDYLRQIERGTKRLPPDGTFDFVCPKQPSKFMYFFTKGFLVLYYKHKWKQAVRFGKKAAKIKELW